MRHPGSASLGRKCQRGIAAVELAILLAFLLVPLTFGVTEIGRAAVQYNTLTKSARDAARYWSTVAPGSPKLPAQCLAITGSSATSGSSCSASVLVPGLTTAMVVVCDRVWCAGTSNLQPVTVNGTTRGTTHLVSITIGVTGNLLRFDSLASFVLPSFNFAPIHATFAVEA